MKIRIGFVSNSSSSSFVLIGKKVKKSVMDKDKFDQGTFYAYGGYLAEGCDVFKVSSYKMLMACFQFPKEIDVYESAFSADTEPPARFNKDDITLEGDLVVISIERDYHSCGSTNDILKSYPRY